MKKKQERSAECETCGEKFYGEHIHDRMIEVCVGKDQDLIYVCRHKRHCIESVKSTAKEVRLA